VPRTDGGPDDEARISSCPRSRLEGKCDENASDEQRGTSAEDLESRISKHRDKKILLWSRAAA